MFAFAGPSDETSAVDRALGAVLSDRPPTEWLTRATGRLLDVARAERVAPVRTRRRAWIAVGAVAATVAVVVGGMFMARRGGEERRVAAAPPAQAREVAPNEPESSEPGPVAAGPVGEGPVGVEDFATESVTSPPNRALDAMAKILRNVHPLLAERATVLVSSGAAAPARLGEAYRSGSAVHVWDWTQGETSRVAPGVEVGGASLAVTPDGRALVVADGRIIDLATGAVTKIDLGPNQVRFAERIFGRIGAMRVSPDGGRIAVRVTNFAPEGTGRFESEVVQVRAFPQGDLLCEFPCDHPYVMPVVFTHDGARVIVAERDGSIVARAVQGGAVLERLSGRLPHIAQALDVDRDGRRVAAFDSHDGVLGIGRLGEPAGTELLMPGISSVQRVRFSPDGRRLAVLVRGRALQVLDAGTGVKLAENRTSFVEDFQWASDGAAIVLVTAEVKELEEPGRAFPKTVEYQPRVGTWTLPEEAR